MEEILPKTTSEITEESETFFTLKSPNSSPSHEFSFTISLNSTKTTPTSTKSKESQFPSAMDLTPADDIFFHGHLLPLHFLSHFHPTSSSPRSSTTASIDNNFQIPAKEITNENKPDNNFPQDVIDNRKSKLFSLSGFTKWVKGSEPKEKPGKTRKLKFDMGQFLRRYVKMVKPWLSSKGGKGENYEGQRKSYSFSGSLSPRVDRRELRDLRDGFSAPASMRTSPTNSGLILAKAGAPSPVSDSTMEELHSAIQAAIAHCKNSTSLENKSHDFCSPSVPVN